MTRLRRTIVCLLIMAAAMSVTACSRPLSQRHTVNATFDVKVTDPDIRQLTEVTSKIELVASGEFTPGTYMYNNTPVTFDPDTHFNMKLSVPIDDPAVIHSKAAVGSLSTSKPFRVRNLPVPQFVELQKGKVSVEIDLIRSLGALFVSYLQKGGDVSDAHQLITALQLHEATLDLRPNSYLQLGRQSFHIGEGSTISLKDVSVGGGYNYQGGCTIHLNFLENCHWATDRNSCDFDGGFANIDLLADKNNNRLVLSLSPKKKQAAELELKKSVFRFGKSLRSSASSESATIIPRALTLQFTRGALAPEFHMASDVELNRTTLVVKSDIQETVAFLPESLPAVLATDQMESGGSAELATKESAVAPTVRISINRKETGVTIWLTDATFGPVTADRSGAFNFELENGTAHLKQLDWHGNKRSFTLATSGGAKVSIPEGLLLGKAGYDSHTQLRMPLDIELGTAKLKGASGQTTLTDLSGKLVVDADKEIQIIGDLDFRLPRSALLGGQPVDITAHGLDLSMEHGGVELELKRCKIVVPQGAIQDVINEKLPDRLEFHLDKTVYEEEKWRYRKAVARNVVVKNLRLANTKPHPPDKVSFTTDSNFKIDGTIEQQQRRKVGETEGDWEVRPWKLTGRMRAEGEAKYKFVARNGPQIDFDLDLELPVPSDVQLDWSQVAQGFLGYVERGVIVGRLRKMVIPVNYHGSVSLFPESSIAKNFRVRNLVVKHTEDSTELDFTASGKF